MNSDADQPSNTSRIDASLAEIHTLIAALEAQLRLGGSSAHLEINAVERSMPKSFSSDREESTFLVER